MTINYLSSSHLRKREVNFITDKFLNLIVEGVLI